MEKKPISYFVTGLILGLVSIILFLVFYFTGQSFKKEAINYLPAVISIGLIIYFVIKWANDNNNNVTFGQCFGYGFKAVAIMTLLVFIFTLIFIFTFPDFKIQFLDSVRQQMEQNNKI